MSTPDAEATLASDSDRESVCQLLSQAFADGRLTSTDLDERTSRALAARTHGELESVLAGLRTRSVPAMWTPQRQQGLFPRLVFWVVGLFTAPFILIGTLALLAGDGPDEWIFGIVLLVIFLPGLIALYRWAHPRS